MQQTPSISTNKTMPRLGLGTWGMGESEARRQIDVAAVRTAIDIGYRLIDTAEMYGEGGAEEVVGHAVAQALRTGQVTRDELFIVSKVYPHNASRAGTQAACERSLRRLGLEHIDLYLLHWPGQHPLSETCAALQSLVTQGRIGRWGVSNFDTGDMERLFALPQGDQCAVNQVYYSLGERGAAFSLLPWQCAHGVPLMAYSPIGQGALAHSKELRAIGLRHAATPAQVALAWVLSQSGVVAIPKAVDEVHQRENFAASGVHLSAQDLAELDRLFPPPARKGPLAML
jgi:diketogulonate reductase-like aldo/keto reductase